jgi:cyclopropane fatty-acyl-phospholipid synthase-like methyltransferase
MPTPHREVAAPPQPLVREPKEAITMNTNKALWEKGDFSRIAATMRTSGERFVDEIGVTAGLHVLDLGSGDVTTAVPAAQLGADVLGVDIASNLVAAGNRRAAALGLSNCRFQERRRVGPHGDRQRDLRSHDQCLRRDVRPQAVRGR